MNSDVVCSLTSFPERIENSWLTIESLIQQEYKCREIVLVLSTEEFKDKDLPSIVKRQIRRGVKVIWTNNNLKSYNKLIPILGLYEDCKIVTFDDDIIYEKTRLGSLVTSSEFNPGCVIAHRCREIPIENGQICKSYNDWPPASPQAANNSTFPTGVGGILYPKVESFRKELGNFEVANTYCPSADDIWFWYCSEVTGVSTICLGNFNIFESRSQLKTSCLWKSNVKENLNDTQLYALLNSPDCRSSLKPYSISHLDR